MMQLQIDCLSRMYLLFHIPLLSTLVHSTYPQTQHLSVWQLLVCLLRSVLPCLLKQRTLRERSKMKSKYVAPCPFPERPSGKLIIIPFLAELRFGLRILLNSLLQTDTSSGRELAGKMKPVGLLCQPRILHSYNRGIK